MRKQLVNAAMNVALIIASLLMLALFCEFVVFRFILPAADLPEEVTVDSVVRYTAGQQGIYRHRNELIAEYRINADGWNSIHSDYAEHKTAPRIAIVGDSYVHAMQVDFDSSFAERLQKDLGIEVYRFGISGAPLSQYLHMTREEIMQFRPDILVVNLVHNDFNESWQFKSGVYSSSFMKLKIGADMVKREIPPQPFKPPWYQFIRRSATWRFLGTRWGLYPSALKALFLDNSDPTQHQANIDIRTVDNGQLNNLMATRYVFAELKRVCAENGTHLLLVMDGLRQQIYRGSTKLGKAGELNLMVREQAESLDIPLLELHPVFEADFKRTGNRYEFPVDAHWNESGHELVAKAIADKVRRLGWVQ